MIIAVALSLVAFLTFGNNQPVKADDRCGPGYTCWESNGGEATVFSRCRPYGNNSYCGGVGGPDYCDCVGSTDCTCTLSGTDCEGGDPYNTGTCYCADVITVCTNDTDCLYGSCGDGGCDGEWECPGPTGTATIGCCYGSDDPGYCGDGTCDSGETCSSCEVDCGVCPPSCDTVSADVEANNQDNNITVSGPYDIDWSSTNASSCTMNGLPVNTSGHQDYDSQSPGSYVYDLYCDNGCGNSDTDSVTVTVDCGTISADVKANGSDADITTYEDYTISWTSSDADDCTLNGGVVALSGSQDESATTEGDYIYNLSCDNFCGDTASDEVTVTVGFCGDGVCSGFETCVDCEADCGECPNAWWQVWGGSLLSGATGSTAINSPVPGERPGVDMRSM